MRKIIDDLYDRLYDLNRTEGSSDSVETALVRRAASRFIPSINELFEIWLGPQKQQLELNIKQFGYRAQHRLDALTTQVEAYLGDPFIQNFEVLPSTKEWHELTRPERLAMWDVVAKKLGVPGGLVELKERLQKLSDSQAASDLLGKTDEWIERGKSLSVKPMLHCLYMLSVSWVLSDPCRKAAADSLISRGKSWCEVITCVCSQCGDGAEPSMSLYVAQRNTN